MRILNIHGYEIDADTIPDSVENVDGYINIYTDCDTIRYRSTDRVISPYCAMILSINLSEIESV